jgi:ubiquinone/menaquinone biosynthesis C-methylase UbiE
MAAALAACVRELVAIDVTPQMLVQTSMLLREKGLSKASTCLADAQNLPFHSETFDVVSCRIVLHHVSNAGKALAEMGRVLKGSGKLFVQDILGSSDRVAREYMDGVERLRDPSHIKDYNLEEWKHLLEAGRLRIIHSETILGVYQLKEWTSRSGTPLDKVEEIVLRLRNMPEEVGHHLKAEYSGGDWLIQMRYLLILATKK